MVLQYEFEESVGYWVVMTAHAFRKALNEELAPHGITYRQWQVLAWLAIEGCLSQSELADRMDIEPATLVTVVSRMERDGWITRESCTEDRRKKLVRPTAAANPVWEKGVQCARRVRGRAVRGFSPEAVTQMRQFLAAMQENLHAPLATSAKRRASNATAVA